MKDTGNAEDGGLRDVEDTATNSTDAEPLERTTPLPGARVALLLMVLINLFNYIDRQVLAAVVRPIEREFFPNADQDLVSKVEAQAKMGLLATAFMVSYMVFAPLFGWLADRWGRWMLVGVGVIVWSLASGGSGLAPASLFGLLLLTRCVVGIGEAAYGPVAPTVISDLYPVKIRGSVLAWFYAAIPVGSALGYVLGGQVAATLGWRWAFYLVVPPGLCLGIWCFLMRDPPRGQADAAQESSGRRATLRDYWILLRTKSYVLDTLGMTAMTFVLGGVAYWMPKYLYENKVTFHFSNQVLSALNDGVVPEAVGVQLQGLENQSFASVSAVEFALSDLLTREQHVLYGEQILEAAADVPLSTINTVFGALVVVTGLGATLLGGWAGDALRQRYAGSYFLVAGLGMLAGFPFFVAVLYAPFPWAWPLIGVAVFFLFFNTGPTNTILANVTHPSLRAPGFALNILVIHALGDAISPPILGALGGYLGMTQAFQFVSVVIVISGLVWLAGARYLAEDTARAPRLLDSSS